MSPLKRLLAAVTLLGVLPLHAQHDAALTAENAWIREAPPGAAVMAGYVTLHNHSAQTLRCTRVSGPDFGAAEIHRSLTKDGHSHMLRDQIVEIPAAGVAQLAPGGLHLMLFRPQRVLAAGDSTTLELDCGSERVSATFVVRSGP